MKYKGFEISAGRGMLISSSGNYYLDEYYGYCEDNFVKVGMRRTKKKAIKILKKQIDISLEIYKCKNKKEYDILTFPKEKSIFTVAECRGGIMEDPDFHYHNYQDIIAYTDKEAIKIYNKKNNCDYYYGSIIGKKPLE